MLFAVTAVGETIAYRRCPGADPVLLVHGFGSDAESTWGATGWLRALEDRGRGAIAVDLRGHGGSSKPHDADAYLPDVLAADLAAVLDAESLSTVDVMGYSMGAQVARAFAHEAPGRIRRLVLGGIGETEQLRLWGLDAIRSVLIDDVDAADETATTILRAAAASPGADREALAACAVGMSSAEPSQEPLEMPALLAAGEADPVAAGADRLAVSLGAEFVAVPSRNHFTTLSARQFKAAVLDFLAG